jgi:hypothetical protein
MINLLMKFLPADKRAMVELAMRMVAKLDTPAERKAVADWGIQAFSDGKISVPEWGELGGRLGILTGPKRNGNGG